MQFYSSPFVEALWSRTNEEVVLFEKQGHRTAGELKSHAVAMAADLRGFGLKNGERVVLAIVPGWTFLVTVYALLLNGAELVLIDPEMGEENYREKLKQLDAKWAIADRRILFVDEHPIIKWIVRRKGIALPAIRKFQGSIFSVGPRLPLVKRVQHLKLKSSDSGSVEFFMNAPEAPTFIVYTSGTVTAPKGVSHSLRSLGESIRLLGELLRREGATHLATHMPHYQLLGVIAGIRVSTWNPNQTPAQKLRFIEENQVTTLFGPPSDFLPLIQYLEVNQLEWPSSLKRIYLGSAPVHVSYLERWFSSPNAPECTCLYGMTEHLMGAYVDGREKLQANVDGDLLGHPFPGVSFREGNDGELEITSDQLFLGYLEREPHSGWHPTGDYGTVDTQGRVILKGRKKDMIIRGNFNIYPALYESTIEKITGVDEAVLVGVYDEGRADEVVGLIIQGKKELSENSILTALKSGATSIDRAAWPDKVYFREIPRSGRSGKVDKEKLRKWMKTQL